MMNVCILWHVRTIEGVDEEKLISVYSDETAAKAAINRLISKPGFRDCPDGFTMDNYEVGKDHWTEGYITV